MAMTISSSSTESMNPLDRRRTNHAAAASIVLAMLGAAGLVAYLAGASASLSAPVMAYLVSLAAMCGLIAVLAVQLLYRRIWAQRCLLIIWLMDLVVMVCGLLAAILWGTPAWWPKDSALAGSLLALNLIGAPVAAVLLVRASQPASRLRYASMVAMSVAVAVMVVLAINLIVHKDPVSGSVERLGRFGVSGRTKTILEGADSQLTLTCVYTDEKNKAAQYRPRVMELLADMAKSSSNVKVANVTALSERAALEARLGKKVAGGKASRHIKFLRNFLDRSRTVTRQLQSEQQNWQKVSDRSYLAMWGLVGEIKRLVRQRREETEKVRAKVARQMSGPGLSDHASLVADATKSLKDTRIVLEQIADLLEQMSRVPADVKAHQKRTVHSAIAAMKAGAVLVKIVGPAGKVDPAKATETLKQFVSAAGKASAACRRAAKALDEVAGKDSSKLVNNSRWLILQRFRLRDLYGTILVKIIENLRMDAETYLNKAKPAAQAELIDKGIRKQVLNLNVLLRQAQAQLGLAIKKLQDVDEPTKKLFQRAKGRKCFQAVTAAIQALLDEADKLPKLETSSLAADLSKPNIVIVEYAGKAEVVDFESVWPLKVRPMGPMDQARSDRRVFDGDSAISSKVLEMTRKTFATVYLTYFRPKVPPQMARGIPRADIEPMNLTTLTERLQQANFKVKEWNLVEEMPGDEDEDETNERPEEDKKTRAADADKPAGGKPPKVLLVLPPPPRMIMPPYARRAAPTPQFGRQEVQSIRREIDSGTPAIFLAHFLWPRQMSLFSPIIQPRYGLAKYLLTDWGIDVKADYRLIQAAPDQTMPGRYKIDPQLFNHLPLSTFAGDHPIGRPLRAQRVLWTDVCPIQTTRTPPAGVGVSVLLAVPPAWKSIWATRRIRELITEFQAKEGSFIRPDYAKGDMAIPQDGVGLPVAVAATRDKKSDKDKATCPARIVVLGVGMSMSDGYLDREVAEIGADRTLTLKDPPRANADLVVNSVYWLIGHNRFIARGPARIKPVEAMTAATQITIKTLCLVVLPLGILATGAAVMWMRRR